MHVGLILVHDLTNRNSFNNLKRWITELFVKLNSSETFRWKDGSEASTEADLLELELPNGHGSIPVLIIGNKDDLLSKDHKKANPLIAEESGTTALELVC
jgi:hypothetical protein